MQFTSRSQHTAHIDDIYIYFHIGIDDDVNVNSGKSFR